MNVKDRPRLGRGLKSLIPNPPQVMATSEPAETSTSTPVPEQGLRTIPLDALDTNPHQPREAMDPIALRELAASIKANGLIQPILVRPAPTTGRFQLIAGHRRTAAAKLLGYTEIAAIIRDDATDERQIEWALVENIHRQDLNPVERARAYKAYIERFQLTHAQAAERLGEDRTTITNFLRLLDLNPGVQDLLGRGLLTAGHAKVLAGITDPARQDALANRAIAEGISVRNLEALIAEQDASPPPALQAEVTPIDVTAHSRNLVAKSPHILELEQSLSRKLGTKLRIFPAKKKNTGKIVIQYFSLDEFDRIVETFEPAAAK